MSLLSALNPPQPNSLGIAQVVMALAGLAVALKWALAPWRRQAEAGAPAPWTQRQAGLTLLVVAIMLALSLIMMLPLAAPIWENLPLARFIAFPWRLLGPALLKSRFGVDEVVTTLLLNFIVLLFVSMMLDGPMKDPTAMGWPQSVALMGELELSKLVPQTRVHTGLLWGMGLALAVWTLMRYTVPGFDIRAVGANARAAQFVGVPVTRTVVLVAMLSGALAGLAGAIEVAGRTSYVTLDMSTGYGYSGIVIAMLAALAGLVALFDLIELLRRCAQEAAP
jgi:ABC-type uncharacterized transport system permease subunit